MSETSILVALAVMIGLAIVGFVSAIWGYRAGLKDGMYLAEEIKKCDSMMDVFALVMRDKHVGPGKLGEKNE